MDKELKETIKEAKKDDTEAKYTAGCAYEKDGKFREAFRWFLDAANDGHIASQIKIGDFYSNGTFIKQDYQKSILWYTRASTYGDPEALMKLADLYKEGLGVEKDLKLAFDLYYRVSSTSENAEALYEIALMAKSGNGTTLDEKKAFIWFKKASELGHTKSKVNLGYCYATGTGCDKNSTLAYEFYKQASDEGNVIATFNLGNCYKSGFGVEKNLEKAIECFEKSSQEGHSYSYTSLAKCYAEKGEDESKIINAYENAYAQGSHKACYYLSEIYADKNDTLSRVEWLIKGQNDVDCLREIGLLCYKGEIVTLDYKKAVESFYKAAEQKDATSAYYLATMYFDGLGVTASEEMGNYYLDLASTLGYKDAMFMMANRIHESNPSKALELLEKCSNLNDAGADYTLGKWYSKGYIVEKDDSKAFNYYSKASNLGNYQAMCNLGIAYANGKGIKQCPELATYWFKKASEGNVISAKFNLAYCYETGTGVEQDITNAINYYISAARDGHSASALKLGELYLNNETCKDMESAIYWLNNAMEKGNEKAYEDLASIYASEEYYDEEKLNYLKSLNKETQE